MPKKTHMYTELSSRNCNVPGCRKKIKQRLVESRLSHNAVRCYAHYLPFRLRGLTDVLAKTLPVKGDQA